MVYDRNSRGGYSGGPYSDGGRDSGGGRDYTYSSARDYDAAGRYRDGSGHGREDHGDRGRPYGERDRGGAAGDRGRSQGWDQGQGGYGSGHDRSEYGARGYGHDRHADHGRFDAGRDKAEYYRVGERGRSGERDRYGQDRGRPDDRGYAGPPQGYEYEERGFFDRAADEVRSWLGNEEAERRREFDQRYDERGGRAVRGDRDDDYHSWRAGQMAALDRDYEDYRRENRSRFEQEFATWRTNRQGQRDALSKVTEHQEVVGSDGAHVGTVDKVKGDGIVLTKKDEDAGGRHHSIPSGWITSVEDRVTLNKSADEAKRLWQDEDRTSAMFGRGDGGGVEGARGSDADRENGSTTGRNLNRSFSGTY